MHRRHPHIAFLLAALALSLLALTGCSTAPTSAEPLPIQYYE